MVARNEALWTIEELGNAVEVVLGADGPVQESGRIRDVPDRRTIRYYTTLGLIDRPAAMRGRTALYGRRHLEQLVAIKRLQAEGLSLAEIQARLSAIAPKELRALSRVPEAFEAPVIAREEVAPARRSFWSEVPEATTQAAEADDASPAENVLATVQLQPNIILTIAARRSPNPDDTRALARAAEPLLNALRARGLIGTDAGAQSDDEQGETT